MTSFIATATLARLFINDVPVTRVGSGMDSAEIDNVQGNVVALTGVGNEQNVGGDVIDLRDTCFLLIITPDLPHTRLVAEAVCLYLS
jgi:hypothetical protein